MRAVQCNESRVPSWIGQGFDMTLLVSRLQNAETGQVVVFYRSKAVRNLPCRLHLNDCASRCILIERLPVHEDAQDCT